MTAVRLIFTKQPTIASTLIRYLTWSRWSHVGIVTAENTLVESMIGTGVREIPQRAATSTPARSRSSTIPARSPRRLSKPSAQIGRPYDLGAIIGFLGRRNWQKDDAWFCSELVAKAFGDAGYPLFRSDRIHRVTPGASMDSGAYTDAGSPSGQIGAQRLTAG